MNLPPAKLTLIVFALSLSGSFHNGYLTIIPNPAAAEYQRFINNSFYDHYGTYLYYSDFHYLWPLFLNLMAIGGFIGALLIEPLAERLGRKRSFYVVVAIQLIGSLASAISYFVNSWELISIGRLISGVAIGISLGLQPMYVSEISPRSVAGFLNSITGISVQLGFIIGSILSLPMVLGTARLWHVLYWIKFVITFATLATLPFIPESPKYILASTSDYDKTRQSLIFFCHENVEEDIKEIEQETSSEKKSMGLKTILKKPYLRRGLILGSLVLFACQCSGIGAIACYSTLLFKKAGVQTEVAPFATVAITFVLLIATIISSFIVDRVGRKPLILVGLLSLAALNLIYIIFTFIGKQTGSSWAGYVVIADNILFTFMFGIGPAVIMWFVIAELMPQGARSTAICFVQASQWIVSCLANAIFFPLSNLIHEWSFFLFIVPLVTVSIYLYFKLPETKNKSTLEIMKSLGYIPGCSRTISKEDPKSGEIINLVCKGQP